MSSSLLDLKKKHSALILEKSQQMKTKCDMVRKSRLQQFNHKSQELDKKERELCRRTKQLVDELVSTCDNTPFHKALIKILSNLKGIILYSPDELFHNSAICKVYVLQEVRRGTTHFVFRKYCSIYPTRIYFSFKLP